MRDRLVRVVRALEHVAEREDHRLPSVRGSRARAPFTTTATPSAFIPVITPMSPGHATLANGIAPSLAHEEHGLVAVEHVARLEVERARRASVCPSFVAPGPRTNAEQPMSGECSKLSAMS